MVKLTADPRKGERDWRTSLKIWLNRLASLFALACLAGFLATSPAAAAMRADCAMGEIAPQPEAAYQTAHAAAVAKIARVQPDTVFLGDSIVEAFAAPPSRPIWRQYYGPYNPANLGMPRDTTANLLWRLRQGELSGGRPKVVVILIGTNDRRCGWNANQTVAGIGRIVSEVRSQKPDARILVVGLLPKAEHDERDAINKVLKQRYGAGRDARFVDVSAPFLTGGGQLNLSLYREKEAAHALHPNPRGVEAIAQLLAPEIGKAMRRP